MCSVVGKQISVHAGRDFVVSSSSPTHRAGPCSSSLHLFNVYEWRRLWSPHSFFIMKRLEPSNRYFLLNIVYVNIPHRVPRNPHAGQSGQLFSPRPTAPLLSKLSCASHQHPKVSSRTTQVSSMCRGSIVGWQAYPLGANRSSL